MKGSRHVWKDSAGMRARRCAVHVLFASKRVIWIASAEAAFAARTREGGDRSGTQRSWRRTKGPNARHRNRDRIEPLRFRGRKSENRGASEILFLRPRAVEFRPFDPSETRARETVAAKKMGLQLGLANWRCCSKLRRRRLAGCGRNRSYRSRGTSRKCPKISPNCSPTRSRPRCSHWFPPGREDRTEHWKSWTRWRVRRIHAFGSAFLGTQFRMALVARGPDCEASANSGAFQQDRPGCGRKGLVKLNRR